MTRVFLIAVAATLAAGVLPASAFPASTSLCPEWCSAHRCKKAEPGPQRVCMNRCMAACRLGVPKRRAHTHGRGSD
jgi:hypothetical protein